MLSESKRARHREYMRNRYASDPEFRAKQLQRVARNNKLMRERVRTYILDYLASHPCVDCGESDPIVLEFDHVRGEKVFNIGDVLGKAMRAFDSIVEEIAKCDVRCANCHRRKTARTHGWRLRDVI